MDQTHNLSLPTIAPNQALKHITHNEALRVLDAVVQLSVLDRDLTTPPASPAEGDRYIVAASPTGAWTGQAGAIAVFEDGGWAFVSPMQGWRAYVVDEAALLVLAGGSWQRVAPTINPASMIGVNTSADATNKLAVASSATLLTHAGAGHQVKVNKAAAADTGSVMFQTNWSGRAELGLTGDDSFHVKVSANGSSWTESLVIDSAGNVGLGTASPAQRLAVAGVVAPATDNAHTLGASGMRWASVWAANGTIQTSDARDKLVDVRIGAEALALLNAIDPVLFRWREGGTEMTEVARLIEVEENIFETRIEKRSTWRRQGDVAVEDVVEDAVPVPVFEAVPCVDEAGEPVMTASESGTLVQKTVLLPRTRKATRIEITPEPASRPGERLHAGFLAQDVKAALDAVGLDFGAWGLENVANPQSRQWLRPDQLIAVLWAATKQIHAEFEALKARHDS